MTNLTILLFPNFLFVLLLPFLIAVISVTYTYVLTQPGQLMSGPYNFLDELFKTDKRALEQKGPHWLFKIIIHCEKCFAGQFALWFFLYYSWNEYYYHFTLYLLFKHIYVIMCSIILSSIFKHKYIKHIENE